MKDEEYVFHSDCREKKNIARSARHARTHNGKSGRVKFPSDNLTRKELNAMNGEVKSYRLNDPMPWKEFKAMPDDIKVTYIKLLRQKFNVPGKQIAEMMGVSAVHYSKEINRLGISEGKHCRGRCTVWDREGWLAWCNGAKLPACSPESVETSFKEDAEKGLASLEAICDPVPVPEIKTLPICGKEKLKAIPCSGSMTFEGKVEDVLETVSVLLGGQMSV